jgi:hypothetical protein
MVNRGRVPAPDRRRSQIVSEPCSVHIATAWKTSSGVRLAAAINTSCGLFR